MGVAVLRCTWVSDVCPVLRHDGGFGWALRFYGVAELWERVLVRGFRVAFLGFLGYVVVFTVQMCKILLFGVGGKSVCSYSSAIRDLRPGLLSIHPNSSGVVRAIITLRSTPNSNILHIWLQFPTRCSACGGTTASTLSRWLRVCPACVQGETPLVGGIFGFNGAPRACAGWDGYARLRSRLPLVGKQGANSGKSTIFGG